MTTLNQPCGKIIDFFGAWIFEPAPENHPENNLSIYTVTGVKVGKISKSHELWTFRPLSEHGLNDGMYVYIH